MNPVETCEAMMTERPNKNLEILKNYLSTLGVEDRGKCAACFKPLEAPKRCGKCKSIFYCSQKCQADNWKVHKTQCKPVQKK